MKTTQMCSPEDFGKSDCNFQLCVGSLLWPEQEELSLHWVKSPVLSQAATIFQ